VRLPFRLAVEVDALYRHFSYTGVGTIGNIITTTRTTSGAWEFPLLLKYRFGSGAARPFIDGGVSFNTLQGLTQTVASATNLSERSAAELDKSTVVGYVTGAGLELKALFLRVTPEIRYTRWGAKHFLDPNGLVKSNQNQAEVLVGISF
jgi:opacity protein-like surface antigen